MSSAHALASASEPIAPQRWVQETFVHWHTEVVGDHKGFTVVLRGYDTGEVDAMLKRIQKALASADSAMRASVRTELDHPVLHVRLRGYDRIEVDDYLRKAIDRLT